MVDQHEALTDIAELIDMVYLVQPSEIWEILVSTKPNWGLVCPYFYRVLCFVSPTITVGIWSRPQSSLAWFPTGVEVIKKFGKFITGKNYPLMFSLQVFPANTNLLLLKHCDKG